MTTNLDDAYDNLRAEARSESGGGDWLSIRNPGDWIAGTFVGYDTRTAPFGEVTVALLVAVRTNSGAFGAADVKRFDLDSRVLQLELLEDGENAPKVGGLVFVEFTGDRVSKTGTRYKGYTVKVGPPTPESLAAVAAAAPAPPAAPASGGGGGAAAVGDDDIPFAASAV